MTARRPAPNTRTTSWATPMWYSTAISDAKNMTTGSTVTAKLPMLPSGGTSAPNTMAIPACEYPITARTPSAMTSMTRTPTGV